MTSTLRASVLAALSLWLGLAAAFARADERPVNLGSQQVTIYPPCLEGPKGPAPVPPFLPACHPLCRMNAWEWRFWFTNYNVGDTMGVGDHQGIGIFGYQYTYDERYHADQGEAWPDKNSFWGVVMRPDERDKPGDALKYALCAQPKRIYEQLIYNHGRTLAQQRSSSFSDLGTSDIPIQVAKTEGKDGRITLDDTTGGMEIVAGINKCLSEIKDGFCDAVCGNCSYVVPTEGLDNETPLGPIVGQSPQFPRLEGDRNVQYMRTTEHEGGARVQIPGLIPAVDAEKQGYRDPFTHCVDTGKPTAEQQAVSRWMTLWTPDGRKNGRVISGRWGHNSNTDAEAEFKAFHRCADSWRNPSIGDVCEPTCGTQHGKEQWPCIDGDNTARGVWNRFDWLMDVDDSTLGNIDPNDPTRNPVPLCRTNGNKVHGM